MTAVITDLPLELGDLEQPFMVWCTQCKVDWCFSYEYNICVREVYKHNKKFNHKNPVDLFVSSAKLDLTNYTH